MNCTRTIDGKLLRKLLLSGFDNLAGNIAYLNAINVFPVSDGDTGNNMKRTYETGISELKSSPSFCEVFSSFIQGVLLGSRGNSGSILSQYFLGIYEFSKGKDRLSVMEFANSLKSAYASAYQAVLQPAEGTILTVMRESIEATLAKIEPDCCLERFFELFAVEIFISVQNTKNTLEILRNNDVVDSGAVGFYLIFDGMKNRLFNHAQDNDYSRMFAGRSVYAADEELTYRYCTEFLLKLHTDRPRDYFAALLGGKGDSLIVTVNGDLLKVHIHTNEPQNILDEFMAFGTYAETKVDDMLLQQELTNATALQKKHDGYMIVSFAHGDGLIETLYDLGCDIVFTATQNYHVSDDNFHLFIDRLVGNEIILLPNSTAIYDAALKLYPPEQFPSVHIVNALNVIDSFFMLSLMIGTDSLRDVLHTFENYAQSGAYVARILSVRIQRETFYVGFSSEQTFINAELYKVLNALLPPEKLAGRSSVVIFRGQTTADEDAQKLESFLEDNGGTEFAVFDGKQDDFDFIIGAI